jgi:hypothetical protein
MLVGAGGGERITDVSAVWTELSDVEQSIYGGMVFMDLSVL